MNQQTRPRSAPRPGSVRLTALVLTALALCASLLLPALPQAQAAEWMEPYLEQVQEWGVMRGDANGNLNEDRSITRAEFVTLVNRAFGYTDMGPNPFSDVDDNAWYAEDIRIAVQAGYFNGTTPSTASPMNLVTREQAAVLLGRCLRFQGVVGAANSTFTDMWNIGGWSRGLVQEAADLGIIQGYPDGTFRPDEPITRGQMACFLVRALGTLVQEPGDQTSGGVYGNLTITTPGVKLKDTTVTGNLYLTGGVGLGDVELENVEVLGKIVICGSGSAEEGKNSVVLRNVTASSLEVDSLAGQFLSLQVEGLTKIETTTVRTSAYVEDRTDDGLGLHVIRLEGLEGQEDPTFQLAGNIKQVWNYTPESTLQIAQGVADIVTVDEKATESILTIDSQAYIRELNLDSATEVGGAGSINHINVNAPDSKVSMLPDTIFVRPGIVSNIGGQDMDNQKGNESSEDPRLLAGFPAAKNIAPTTADVVFRTNKTGTIYWALTALMDGSLTEEQILNASSNPKVIRSGTLNATASNTDFTTKLTGLTRQGSYYISAFLEDARGRRSPVKVAAFTTPDDTAPNFASGYPQPVILTTDADGAQVAQVMVMATKDCQMYYVLLPKNSTAPTAADFRTGAISGSLGQGVVSLKKNTPFLVSRINTSYLQEKTDYDLYLWLSDADNGKSSAVRKLTFTTNDITAPTILRLEVRSVTAASVTLSFALDEPGTLSWAVVPQGAAFFRNGVDKNNPTREGQIQIENAVVTGNVIRKGGPIRTANADTDTSFTVSGLQPQTSYDLYYMAKDTAGNYCVYNKAIEFPFPIKTLDTQEPSAQMEFSQFNEGSNGVINPWVDSDVSIVFDEVVRGTVDPNAELYDEFYELYQRVQSSGGEAQAAAKNELAAALRRHITFYPGNPPSSGKPRTDPVTEITGPTTQEQLDALSAWIDFREAVVTQSNAQTTITFPGTVGIKLQSGGTYFFMLQDIEDTSGNSMRPNPTYLPSFTTAYATVYVNNNENEEYVTVDGVQKPAKIFYLSPEGTQAVPNNTRWDMLIWTNANIRYDLYVRERSGDPQWFHLGQPNINLSHISANRAFTSLNGNFSQAQKDSGFFGYEDGEQGRPYLNRLTSDLEFAIVPVDTALNSPVHMEVQLFAGSNTELQGIAVNGQGTPTHVSGRDITAIGDPDPFPIDFRETDQAPKVWVPRGGFNVGSTAAQVQLNVDRNGTVSYFAVPLTIDSANPESYAMFETYPLVNGVTPNLSDIPTSANRDEDGLVLDIDHPRVDDIINGNANNPETAYGNTGSELLSKNGTLLTIRGQGGEPLKPNTTYLLYLATETTSGTQAANVVCYKFTTSDVSIPKLEVSYDGDNRVSVRTDEDASVWGVLILDGSNSFLLQPFSTAAGTATQDTGYSKAGGSGSNGEYLVLDALMNHYGSGNQVKNSIFDIFATSEAKRSVQDLINSQQTTTYSVVDIVQAFNVTGNGSWASVRPLNIDNKALLYCFLACAQSSLGSESSYRAIRPIQMAGSEGPKVQHVDVNITDDEGSVSILFTNYLYFQDTSGIQTFRPVSPTTINNCLANGGEYISVQTVCEAAQFGNWRILTEDDPTSPSSSVTPHTTNRLEFRTDTPMIGSYTFSIKPGLCDQWGNPKSTTGFSVSVTIGKDINGNWTHTVTEVPRDWRA